MDNWTPKQLEEHLSRGDTVFLKLWKKGCGPCKLSISATERLEAQNDQGMIFGQIELGEFPEMSEIAETDVMPAFFIFSKGEMKGKLIGFKGLQRLQDFVQESLGGTGA